MNNTFGINIIPENEAERIEVVERYQILDTPPEHAFDNVALLAAQIFQVPISLVSLVGAEQVFFKANVGMGRIKSSSRGSSLCSLAILKPEVTVFEDASIEPCLLANPLLAGDFGLRFYAGAPLITHDGFPIGTLCIIDRSARMFSEQDRLILQGLAKIVMDAVELRLSAIQEAENQKQITARLAESEVLKNIAIEQAQLGLWHIDAETRDFVASDKLKEFFGYNPEEEMPYEAAVEQIREDYRAQVVAEVNAAIRDDKFYHMEYPVISYHDKKLKWVRATGKLNVAQNGNPSYFLGTMLDITEQKKDEQRKNDFIAMVSHELKTPLTSMKGYVQMLTSIAQKNHDNFSLSTLEKADRQVNKMTSMVSGFLDVSRFETGKIYIDKQRFDLAGLIRESEEETLATITSHKVIFAPVEETIVEADRDKIGQVITNLITNAVKYSPLDSVIRVACVTFESTAQVSVQDEGMGIQPQDIDHLFDRFYRVENNQVDKIKGFGIGLYLCSEIIQRHEGKIWVQSAQGHGSTFYFSLPIAV